MQPIHANQRGRRYHYYVSSPRVHGEARKVGSLPRIPAPTMDRAVLDATAAKLSPSWRAGEALETRVRSALRRVALGEAAIAVEIDPEACEAGAGHELEDSAVRFVVPIRLKHRQGATLIAAEGSAQPSSPRLDRTLVRAVSLARDWRRRLEAGEATSIGELAHRLGLCRRHAGRIAPLGYLAPDLVSMILEGRQPPAMNLHALTKATLPLAWTDQRRLVASFA
jgi:hypothetical protein